MSTEPDIDKHLKEFSDALQNEGTSIKQIGSALRDQPSALKERTWKAVVKEKEELTTFVEIYTVVLSIVAYALKSENISYKPPKNYMKALVKRISIKLPQEHNNPLLTKFDFMNHLHNIFYEIHEDIHPTAIINDDTEQESSIPKTSDVIEVNISTAYVCKTWQVGTKCKVLRFERDGVDYTDRECLVQEVYNEDFKSYLVKFTDTLPETYIPADKLESVAMGSNTDDTAITAGVGGEADEGTTTRSSDDTGGRHMDLDIDCSNAAYNAQEAARGSWEFLKTHPRLLFVFVIFVVMVVISSSIVHGGRMKVRDGKEYEESSTEEKCLILSYERSKCEFECGSNGCDNYKSKYKGEVYDCDADSGEDDCKGWDYLYTATAQGKCGSVELYSNNFDVLQSCNGKSPLNISSEVDCYVLDCNEQEFSVNHFSEFADVGTGEIIGGGIFLGIVLCCFCGFVGCGCRS